jgi:Pyruvate/2-oxoacid:ferredoxin oxidoreductase gamma subunit
VLKEQLEANEAKDKEILELRKRLEVVDSNFKALSQANEELEREKAVS